MSEHSDQTAAIENRSVGWVRLHRQITESMVFADAELLKLWIWILTKSSNKRRHLSMSTGRGTKIITLEPGQSVVGRVKSAEELGWPPSTFRNRLQKLIDLRMVSATPDTHWSIVSVTNWGDFQRRATKDRTGKGQAKDELRTSNGQAKDKLRTQYKNVKKVENVQNVENERISSEAIASESIDSDLLEFIRWWNRMHSKGYVFAGMSATPSETAIKAFRKNRKSKELRGLISDLPKLEAEIARASDFLRAGWFTLPKLLAGKNQDGEYIAQRVLDGCYRQSAKPAKTANCGPGVTFQPDLIGDPNYGRM